MTMTEKRPTVYGVHKLYTFDTIPEGPNGPNIYGGHAHSGQKREKALKRFAAGDTTVIVFFGDDFGNVRQITDPTDVSWPLEYRPAEDEEDQA